MKLVLQAIKSSPADEANSIVESIRSDYSLEDLVSFIQSRGGELSEASPSSFTSTSNSASAEIDSPPRRPVNLNSPDSAYASHIERQPPYSEQDLELPPITNHHHHHHHHHDHRRYRSTQGTKLPVFEASPSSHPLDDHEYRRRFPPTL
ncbi:hypothetical protein H072_5824 [Dactylellina haptotyla CBS 200.50]|uniref:Uncharacterized protein n=1 Tax=Dactylellina haptotyla (strain CBS 200.50) TaxID=1284197 RepID=S8BYH3_DACHA|nr:hypothetical protein H072_5824 [Dactylellina haptotyla CBS 200.50]